MRKPGSYGKGLRPPSPIIRWPGRQPLKLKGLALSPGALRCTATFRIPHWLPDANRLAVLPPAVFTRNRIFGIAQPISCWRCKQTMEVTPTAITILGGNDSLPNVHVAVTSIAGMALMASSKHLPANDPRQMLIGQAVDSAADFVADDANLNYQDRDELVWALAYRCRFLARKPDKTETQTLALRRMVETLAAMQTATGGWFHEYPNPFVTATALAALAEAQRAGIEVSQGVIQKGTKSLAGDRFNNGAYPYSSRQPNNQPATKTQIAASGGRMPLCEMALKVWGRTTDDALTRAIDQSFKLNDNLMAALKYDDHTSRFAYGGFFFWYDVRGRSEAIASLPDSESKIRFQNLQRELILSLPEIDGCFVDSHELGRVYGTAMALLSLHACGVKAE
jgi:hypothetical protein